MHTAIMQANALAEQQHGDQFAPMGVGVLRPFVVNGKTYVSYKASTGKMRSLELNVNGTLRKDEWKQMDDVLNKVKDERLVGIADLRAKGLVKPIQDALGTMVYEYEDSSDAMEAQVSMDGNAKAKNDTLSYGIKYLPLPIIHADFEINARRLAASRRNGGGLETDSLERAARAVNEKLEEMLFTNYSYSYGGGAIKSYISFTNRNTYSIPKAWNASDKTPTLIYDDVLAMKQKAIDDRYYGPYTLYIPTAYETVLDKPYYAGGTGTTAPNKTIRQAILDIARIEDIKVVDKLPANNVVLVQMTSDVVRLIDGVGLTTVEDMKNNNFTSSYKVMTIQVPQLRADQDGRCGIVHGSV